MERIIKRLVVYFLGLYSGFLSFNTLLRSCYALMPRATEKIDVLLANKLIFDDKLSDKGLL